MTTLDTLKKQYSATRRILWVYPVLLIAAAVLIFVNSYAAFAMLGIAVLVQIFVFRRLQKKYQSDVADAIVENTVCKKLESAKYTPADGGAMSPETVKAAVLLPYRDEKGGCLLKMGVDGSEDGRRVSLCDATMLQRFQLVKNGKSRVHFVSGCLIRVQLKSDTGCDRQIVDKDLMPTPVRLEYYSSRIEEDDASALGESFISYKSPDSAPLPAGFAKQLGLLAAYTPGKIGISLRSNTLTVFLRDRFLARPISFSKAPTQELLDFDPMPELAYIIRMAKAIDNEK